jgi:predicted RNase H-like nuclease (RuvC/YqgF family)
MTICCTRELFARFSSRIQQAITKRDEQVRGLRTQYETAVRRAEHLEGLLAQQRKQLAAMPSKSKKHHPAS